MIKMYTIISHKTRFIFARFIISTSAENGMRRAEELDFPAPMSGEKLTKLIKLLLY